MAAKQEPLVAVYSPDGVREVHTRPNARDLVMGAGWSWHPKSAPTPAGFAPFRTVKADGPEAALAQSVLDRTGGSGTVKTGPEADADEDIIHVSAEGDAQVIDAGASAAPAPAQEVIDAAAPTAEPEVIDAAAPSGRGRRRATQAADEG